jgi:hypothetical protein
LIKKLKNLGAKHPNFSHGCSVKLIKSAGKQISNSVNDHFKKISKKGHYYFLILTLKNIF